MEWADALENNKRKATGQMRARNGARCCLCVAEDLAGHRAQVEEDKFPLPKTSEYYGWLWKGAPDNNPNMGAEGATCSELNDGDNLTHKQIAAIVRKEYAEENLVVESE